MGAHRGVRGALPRGSNLAKGEKKTMTISELIEMSVGELREFLAYADSDAKLLDLMEDSEWSDGDTEYSISSYDEDEDAEHEDEDWGALDPEVQGICEDIIEDIEMGRSDLDSIERTVIDNYGIEAYNYIVAHF